MSIDWNRPYGTIFGSLPHNGKYSQDGKYFNARGDQVWPEPETDPNQAKDTDETGFIEGDDLENAANKLRSEGLTNTEIGEKLGVSRQKITRILMNDSQ